MARFILTLLALSLAAQATLAKPKAARIYRQAGKSKIVITVTDRLAGAVDSLIWDGVEFIDSADHGRQLQSASNFDAGGKFIPETFNPTEAGSLSDGAGPKSTSKLIGIQISPDKRELRTVTQMAFWLRPGEKTQGHPARNTAPLSNHLLTKHIKIGHGKLDHVLEYTVTFTVPAGENHTFAQFEALTGYMPRRFSSFWKYIPRKRGLEQLDAGPGEQFYPVVLSTPNGSHAMGVYSPDLPPPGFAGTGYGRFNFPAAKVNKWNCVYRISEPKGIKPGNYTYRMFVPVGTIADVALALAALHDEFEK